MAFKFTFRHKGEKYDVRGTYGQGDGKGFLVTRLLPGAKRMTGAGGGGQPSGMKVEKRVNAENAERLFAELRKRYPELTGFKPV